MSGVLKTAGIDRRSFLKGGAIAGAGAALMLAGCSPQSKAESGGNSNAEGISAGSQPADETVETGFVVVGSGMAGFCAALEAAEGGCPVVMIEKNASVGGSTLFAEGVFGNDTDFQREQGYDPADISEILVDEMDYSHGIVNAGLFEDYLNAAPDYIKWLTGYGVSFESLADAGSGRFCLHIYKGGNGTSAIEALQKASEQAGVDIRTGVAATELILEGDAVVGVRAVADGKTIDFKAPTVCIATGGIGSSEDMMSRYTVLDSGKWAYMGNTGQDGDGIAMVERTAHGPGKPVCAQNMWMRVEGADVKNPANAVAAFEGTNIYVNEAGERFFNEALVQDFFVGNNAVIQQGSVHAIFDQRHVEFFKENGGTCAWSGFSPFMIPQPDIQEDIDGLVANEGVGLFRADTLDELAEQIGVDAAALKETVGQYNSDVAAGSDSQYGKAPEMLIAVDSAPFYAAKVQSLVLVTMGGIRINRKGQVIAPDGTAIDGLYAAGVCVNGFCGQVYSVAAPGTAQGPAVYTGRLAGAAAVERA